MKKKIKKTKFLLFLGAVFLWLMLSVTIPHLKANDTVYTIFKLDLVVALFIPFFLLNYTLPKNISNTSKFILFLHTTLIASLVYSPKLLNNILIQRNFAGKITDIVPEYGWLHVTYTAHFLVLFMAAIFFLISRIQTADRVEKTRSKILAAGLIISAAVEFTHAFALPYIGTQSLNTAMFGRLSILLLWILVLFLITRYRFLNIRIIYKGKKRVFDPSKIVSSIEHAAKKEAALRKLTETIQAELKQALVSTTIIFTDIHTHSSKIRKIIESVDFFDENLIISQKTYLSKRRSGEAKKILRKLSAQKISAIIQVKNNQKTAILIKKKSSKGKLCKKEIEILEEFTPHITLSLRYAILFHNARERINVVEKASANKKA